MEVIENCELEFDQLCATLLRKRRVLGFLSNIPKTCFILEKQNTINIGHDKIPVSETQNGNFVCGFGVHPV